MSFYFVQFVTGLASACSLFLVASGLSIIFGVTRIVNFAHGAFYMLGAYVAFTLTDRFSGAFGFWGAIGLAAIVVAAIGALVEMSLLRRIYDAPELFQLLATFGVTLAVEDLVAADLGTERSARPARARVSRARSTSSASRSRPTICCSSRSGRCPGAAVAVVPPHDAGACWCARRRRTAKWSAALGVNQKWLFTSVFALGVFLAALGGALELPREAANHTMDLQVITEALVVVVIGGLGSVPGTFLAAIIVSELNAFGILVLPEDLDRPACSWSWRSCSSCGPGACSGAPEGDRARGERLVDPALAPARRRGDRVFVALGLGRRRAAAARGRRLSRSASQPKC